MTINAVSPWVGALEWVGDPNSGTSRSGKPWRSVDFTLRYQDHLMAERHITFSAFGDTLVNKILAVPLGAEVKVLWWPESIQSRDGSRWFPKLSAVSISAAQTFAQQETQQVPAQSPAPAPAQTSGYTAVPQPTPDDDLPF